MAEKWNPSIYLKGNLDHLSTVLIATLLISPTTWDFPKGQRSSHISLEISVAQCFARHILFINYWNISKHYANFEDQNTANLHINIVISKVPAMYNNSCNLPSPKEIATHSSTLDWKIPRMEEPGRLQSMGSQRVGHDWATSLSLSLSLDM